MGHVDLGAWGDGRACAPTYKQGVIGSKINYHSISYRFITHFSIETAGIFDLDAELKIWISGKQLPVPKQFNKRLSIYEVQFVLASYVIR